MIAFPNCKINIGLNICSKRDDGFHNIESLFYPVPFCDILEIVESGAEAHIQLTGIKLESPEGDNLCVRAWKILREKFKIPGIEIYLHKMIPAGSGLGGGSSDAAFTLKLLNELFELNIGMQELKDIAAELGSDCPFFIENIPSYVTGRGERMVPADIQLDGYYALLVDPGLHISTANAYAGVIPSIPSLDLKAQLQLPVNQWKESVSNDFEAQLFLEYTVLSDLKTSLYEMGADYVSMSGSGSAIYGLFKENPLEKQRGFSCKLLGLYQL